MASHNIITKQKRIALVCLFSIAISAPSFADDGMRLSQSYAKFDQSGQLIRPSGYREWIFVGTPLTPNDMNDGKAAFPEFHNVYIDPVSWEYWKKLGEFPDGTIIVKELVSVGSKQAPSGNGYFQGEYIGLEAMVKSGQRFPKEPGNWGFFRFTIEDSSMLHSEALPQPAENCQACHQRHAAKDQVFTQFYPVLRAAAGKGLAGTGR